MQEDAVMPAHTKSHDHSSHWDRMGIGISAICLVHCLAMPVLMVAAPMLLVQFHDWPVHIILAFLIVPIGFVAFWTGFRRHKQKRIFIMGILGISLVGLAPLLLEALSVSLSPRNEILFMIPGSALLIFAHFQNQRCHC